MDPKRKFFLFKQSNNFCAAPWTNLYLESNGNILTCCVGKTVLGNIRTQSLDEILAGSNARDIKQNLLEDQPHINCRVCNSLKSTDDSWLRGHYNNIGKLVDVDYSNVDIFSLGAVDARWSNTCNFKCVYCDPKYSSSIERETNIIFSNGDVGNDQVLNFILKNQANIKEIYLAGGEPLLMKENRLFLEQYTNFDTKLRINTNLSNINEKNSILSLIKRFKDVLWTISVENTKDRYEYTRHGGDWTEFVKNINTVQQLGYTIRFNMIYFVGNALTFLEDFNFLKDLVPDCGFSVVPIIGFGAISSRNLPAQLKPQAQQDLTTLIDSLENNSALRNNIINCLNELNNEPNELD